MVHVELGAGRATGHPLAADRLQAVLHRALGVRQPGDGAVLVAYDGHLAHLRKGHQPPVRGVLPGDAVVEQHVARRVDAGDVEVAQPPQVEATADHRVHAAGQVVLDDRPVSGGAEDEVADLAVTASRAHRHAHASYVVGERQRGQTCSELGAHLVSGRRGVGPGEVEVDDRVLARRAVGDVRRHRGDQLGALGELVHRADRGHQPGRPLVERVARQHGRSRSVGTAVERAHVVQGVLAVVTSCQHLQHRLPVRDALLEALAQEPDRLLGDRCQRLDASYPVGGIGRRGERRDLVAHARQDLRALHVDRRLVEPAEADAAGQVADARVARLRDATDALQHLTRPAGQLTDRRGLAAPRAEQCGDECDLGGRALLGQEDAEDRGLQLGRAVQRVDAVVPQHAAQPLAELLGEPAAVGVEALQVGVEVLTRAVHAQLGLAVLVHGPVAGQLGEVGEDLEQRHLVGQLPGPAR